LFKKGQTVARLKEVGLGMGYLKADARADLLLNAAKKIMKSEGFAAVTARKIALESGAAIGHINRHFTSLRELKHQAFLALIHEKVERHKRTCETLSGIDAVISLLDDCKEEPHMIELWREVSVLAHQDRRLQEILVYGLNLWHGVVSGMIASGIKQKALRCHDTASATAWRLIALVLGQDSLAMHGVVSGNQEQLRSDLLHVIRLELLPTEPGR
jgi:AcrR family transcriptional regulator